MSSVKGTHVKRLIDKNHNPRVRVKKEGIRQGLLHSDEAK